MSSSSLVDRIEDRPAKSPVSPTRQDQWVSSALIFDKDPGGVGKHATKGEFLFPLGNLWNNGITIRQGYAPVKKYNVYLRDLIRR